MGWGQVEWDWHMGMSYLTSLNPHLFKNIAYVGSFEHFSVQLFLHVFCTRPRPAPLTAVKGITWFLPKEQFSQKCQQSSEHKSHFIYNLLSLNFCLSSQSICVFVFVHLWITGSDCLPYLIYRVMLPPPLFSLNFCLSLQSFFSFSACLSPPRNLVITDFRNLRGYCRFKNYRAGTWPALEGNKDVC